MTPKETLQAALNKHRLDMRAFFVPQSKSRNALAGGIALDKLSLNWDIQVLCRDRQLYTCPYTQGIAHCPSYKPYVMPRDNSNDYVLTLHEECEKGRHVPEPDVCDVFYCLIAEGDVLSASGFEEWADNFGYDTDSRKAEAIYKECLEHAIKLHAAVGATAFIELQEAIQDY